MKQKMQLRKAIQCAIIALLVNTVTYRATGQMNDQFRVLVYAGYDRWHGQDVPDAIKAMEELSDKYLFGLEWTQLEDIFGTERLFDFDAVVFLNANANKFNEGQLENFRKFIHNGGGYVGIHAAMGEGEWYRQLMGREFQFHPPVQTAVLDIVDRNFPATMHMADRMLWTDEWYSFGESLTKNQKVVMTVDESSYHAEGTGRHAGKPGMGDFHPIAWYQEFDGGRCFYTALGHYKELYRDPRFIEHIYGGILWAATGKGIKPEK